MTVDSTAQPTVSTETSTIPSDTEKQLEKMREKVEELTTKLKATEEDHRGYKEKGFLVCLAVAVVVCAWFFAWCVDQVVGPEDVRRFEDFNWVKFKFDALDKMANISSYDMKEIEYLNNLETLDNSVFDATSNVSIGSWKLYRFFKEKTDYVARASPANKQKVWQRFVQIVNLDRERRVREQGERHEANHRLASNALFFGTLGSLVVSACISSVVTYLWQDRLNP
jgi:uncharacterized coiled-coil protein SlyX